MHLSVNNLALTYQLVSLVHLFWCRFEKPSNYNRSVEKKPHHVVKCEDRPIETENNEQTKARTKLAHVIGRGLFCVQ